MNSGRTPAPTVQPGGACRSPHSCWRASARRCSSRDRAGTHSPADLTAQMGRKRAARDSATACPEVSGNVASRFVVRNVSAWMRSVHPRDGRADNRVASGAFGGWRSRFRPFARRRRPVCAHAPRSRGWDGETACALSRPWGKTSAIGLSCVVAPGRPGGRVCGSSSTEVRWSRGAGSATRMGARWPLLSIVVAVPTAFGCAVLAAADGRWQEARARFASWARPRLPPAREPREGLMPILHSQLSPGEGDSLLGCRLLACWRGFRWWSGSAASGVG